MLIGVMPLSSIEAVDPIDEVQFHKYPVNGRFRGLNSLERVPGMRLPI